MSPEQVKEHALDHQTDIYSMGVVLYNLLTGRLPFRATNNFTLIYQITNVAAEPPSAFRPEIPAGLDALVLRAMAKDLGTRYRHWEEFSLDLAELFRARYQRGKTDEPFADTDKFDTLRKLPFFHADPARSPVDGEPAPVGLTQRRAAFREDGQRGSRRRLRGGSRRAAGAQAGGVARTRGGLARRGERRGIHRPRVSRAAVDGRLRRPGQDARRGASPRRAALRLASRQLYRRDAAAERRVRRLGNVLARAAPAPAIGAGKEKRLRHRGSSSRGSAQGAPACAVAPSRRPLARQCGLCRRRPGGFRPGRVLRRP